MSAERFTLDTNILVYALDARAGERRALAGEIIRLAVLRDCRLTLQSISEFYAATTRNGLVPRSEASAQANDWLIMFRPLAASADALRLALNAAASGLASYRDALLVATASEGGCTTILTEALGDGGSLFGVRILNPFSGSALSPDAAALLGSG